MMRELLTFNQVVTQYYREDLLQISKEYWYQRNGWHWPHNNWKGWECKHGALYRKLIWTFWNIYKKTSSALRKKARYLIVIVNCRLFLVVFILAEHLSIRKQLDMRAINEVVHMLTQCLKFCHDSFELRLLLVLILSESILWCF